MARDLPNPPPGFEELSADEKLDYVQSLWDRLAAHPEAIPVPAWHQRVIEERLARHQEDPDSARPWEEVREDVSDKLKGFRSRRE